MTDSRSLPHKTKPETFILESLSNADEASARLEGKALYEILRIQGKKPIYYYFRTQSELAHFAGVFHNSGYRYLHLSCHGNETHLAFTIEQIRYKVFSDIFANKLNNRRLFISGCNLGNRALAEAIFTKNGGMYSITAPTREVFFRQTTAFWPTFYYMMHAWDTQNMKKRRLVFALTRLSQIFEMPMAHYFKNAKKRGTVDEQIFHFEGVQEALRPATDPLAGEMTPI